MHAARTGCSIPQLLTFCKEASNRVLAHVMRLHGRALAEGQSFGTGSVNWLVLRAQVGLSEHLGETAWARLQFRIQC
jgi:hypothetical protein